MIYTIEKATLISEQLRRFTSGYAHHITGQFANIDFWLDEVKASIKTIDDYNDRFNKIREEQKKWVEAHGTVVFDYCPYCGGKCEFANGKPSPPVRISSHELKQTKKELIDAAYFFLVRCCRIGLLDENLLEIKCKEIGTGVEPSDLEK